MDKFKQELIDLLEEKGFSEATDKLYDPNYTVSQWEKDYDYLKLQVPGLLALLSKDRSVKLPHNLRPETALNLLEGDTEEALQYDAQEQQLKKDIEDKSKLAEEYKRANEWSWKLPQGTPIIGGMELANPYAAKHYAKGETGQAVTNEIAGKVAGVLDYVPLFGLAAPAIRSTQKWAADEDLDRTDAVDWGLGALGFIKKIPGIRGAAKKVVDKVAGWGNKSLGSGTSTAASKELLKGKGKVVKDLLDNDIAYGTTRKTVLPDRESLTDMATEKDYEKAIQYVYDKYKDDWKHGFNRPMSDDPLIMREAFKRWNSDNMQSLAK